VTTITARRVRSRRADATGRAAEVAGALVGNVGRGLPGIAGPLLVCYGLFEIYRPVAFIAAGVFLLLLDRRIP
jgi:hypothetical protein